MEDRVEIPIMELLRSLNDQDMRDIADIAVGSYDSLSDEIRKAMLYEPYEYSKKVPLMSISEVSENKAFPPSNQKSRIDCYRRNKLIYNNRLKDALPGIGKKLAVMDKYSALKGLSVYLAHPSTENFCRTITDAKLQFMYSSGVKINSNKNKTNSNIELVSNTIKNQRLIQKIVIDISRYGEGIVVIETGRKPKYVEPKNWFPVVDMEADEIKCHIITETFISYDKNKKQHEFIRVDYHFKGYYDRYIFEYSTGGIGKEISKKTGIKTGIDNEYAVVVFNNSLDAMNLFGSDDYTLILSQIEDLVVSGCIESFCVHKFHFPTFQGPRDSTAIQKDGSYKFEMKQFYETKQNSGEIKQIDVNFNIEAIIKHRDELKKAIAMITGMKGTINDNKENGYAESGKARELRYADDIGSTNKIKTFIEVQLKELVVKEGIVEGYDIDINDVNIIWSPAIQMNQFDRAELAGILLGNKQIKSRQSVLEEVYEKDSETAMQEYNEFLAEINDEKGLKGNSL